MYMAKGEEEREGVGKIFKRMCGPMIDTTINNMRLMEVISMYVHISSGCDLRFVESTREMLQFNDALLVTF